MSSCGPALRYSRANIEPISTIASNINNTTTTTMSFCITFLFKPANLSPLPSRDHFAKTIASQNPHLPVLRRNKQLRLKRCLPIRGRQVLKPAVIPPGNFIIGTVPNPAGLVGDKHGYMFAGQAAILRQFLERAGGESKDVSVARQKPQPAIAVGALKNRPRTGRRRGNFPIQIGSSRIALQDFAKLGDERDEIRRRVHERGVQI